MSVSKSQKKLSEYRVLMGLGEGLSFSDYFDDDIPYEQKPPEMLCPMQEDDYPIQAKDLFKGLWEDVLDKEQYWLDPNGKFISSEGSHFRWARKYLSNIPHDPNNVYEEMEKRKFIRVKIISRELHIEYGLQPSTTQWKNLIQAVEDSNLTGLYDDTKRRYVDLRESSITLKTIIKDIISDIYK